MTCPKCGETRLIERVDGLRWFCAVCAHSWTVGARNDVTDRAAYATRRNARPSRRRFFGSPRLCQGSASDAMLGSRP
jgi:ribosomal protein L37AE/L43A